MATWGEFIKEVPIINKRSEGIFVKADHVLDLWEERNRLRVELAQALSGAGGGRVAESAVAEAVAREREACAQEIEAMAEALAAEPEPQESMIQMLQAVGRLIRDKSTSGDAPMAEEIESEELVEAPLAEPLTGEAAPMAEPVAAEPLPWLRSEVVENLEREGLPPR
jgi:hypothetical protein